MAKLVVGVGMPASGKTTVLKAFADKNGYFYISPDDIRHEIAGDVKDQSKNEEVWQIAYARLAENLKAGKATVFDATFVKPYERRDFLKFARQNGANTLKVYLLMCRLRLL